MPAGDLVPTVADVTAIAAYPEPVLRNLLITHCYHELALAVRERTGPGANWCTYASWASRQAGRTIRREDLREALLARMETPALRAAAEAVVAHAGSALEGSAGSRAGPRRGGRGARLAAEVVAALEVDGALRRASAAVAAGNLKVFEEIAAEFARFLEALRDDAAGMRMFLDRLRPGEPPGGQRLLRDAFAAYHEAMTRTPQDRAQLLLYANLLVGLHEQTRLQPEIAAAMNCAFDGDAVRERLLRALVPGTWRRLRTPCGAARHAPAPGSCP